MTIGDIHWIELPPGTGHEQSGRRPAVVILEDSYGTILPVVLVVPLTTAVSIMLSGDAADPAQSPEWPATAVRRVGLPDASRRPTAIDGRLGTVGVDVVAESFEALDKLFGKVTQRMATELPTMNWREYVGRFSVEFELANHKDIMLAEAGFLPKEQVRRHGSPASSIREPRGLSCRPRS